MTSLPRADHYVYVLFREDGSPFYVGLGRGPRWLAHEKLAKYGERSQKANIIRRILAKQASVGKAKIAEFLTREEALRLEVSIISSIGRKPFGTLVNETSGGEGVTDPSAETRKKMSESAVRRCSVEWRAKMKEAVIRQFSSPEGRAKHIAAQRRRWADPEKRESARLLRVTPEYRAAQSAAAYKRWADPSFRAKIGKAISNGMARKKIK